MLYIIIEEHSGILLNIYRCLSNAGYKIISNKFGKKTDDGRSYVQLDVEQGAIPLPPSVEGDLLNINGCSDILYEKPLNKTKAMSNNGTSELESTKLKTEIKKVCIDILNNFENIENFVHSFRQHHHGPKCSSQLVSLGIAVGSAIYEVEYALGKPLKLELVLKRMLSDAIKDFGKVSCNNHIISIEHNIFCDVADSNGHCDFTKGFMIGFMHSSPTTKTVRVENIACRCQGRSSCSFEFH